MNSNLSIKPWGRRAGRSFRVRGAKFSRCNRRRGNTHQQHTSGDLSDEDARRDLFFEQKPASRGADRAGIKESSKAIRGGELPRIGFVSNKSTYENTHPVRRDLCSGWTLVLHDRGQGTGGHDHDYPYGDGGRTHSDQHEYDCDQAKRRRLLSRQFEFVAKRGTPHASPFFVVASYYIEGYRCYPSLGRCFGFFDCLLTNDWRDCL